MTLNQAGRRLAGVASFDPNAYEELRDDLAATPMAIAVVVVSTVAAAIGGVLWTIIAAAPPQIYKIALGHFVIRSLVLGSIIQIGFWFAWVFATFWWLRYVSFVRDVDPQRLLRTMGFAFVPMSLQLLLFFPVFEFPIGLIAVAATFGCSVLAVRAASNATPTQALVSTLFGFTIFVFALGILGTSDSDLAPGIFALDPNSLSVAVELDLESGR